MCCGTGCCLCCSCRSFSSAGVRIAYFLMFAMMMCIAWIMRSDGVQSSLTTQSNWPHWIFSISCNSSPNVDEEACIGLFASYRIVLGYIFFSAIMCAMTLGSSRRGDMRGSIHSSWWPVKILVLLVLSFVAFFLDDDTVSNFYWAAFVLSLIYIVFQILMFIGTAYRSSDSVVDSFEDGGSCRRFFTYALALILFIAIIAITVVMFIFFTKESGCDFNKFFISINLVLFLVAAVTSLIPKVQEANPSSNILPVLLIGLFQTYLCWAGIASRPDYDECTSVSSSLKAQTPSIVVGMILLFIVAWWFVVNSVRNDDQTPWNEVFVADGQEEAAKDEDNEYNFSLFHVFFILAACYGLMVLSSWNKFEEKTIGSDSGYVLSQSNAAFWANVIMSWLVWLTLEWSLVAPACCPDRFDSVI
eukprot:m.113801 g.113801  ORF g.113801 m.113801 type:complete len:416 (-) comp12803_c0_seq1:1187-2434(-)